MHRGYKWIITIVIVILLLRFTLMQSIGSYLIADHDLVKADAIVVLMGGPTTKVPEAADLYLDGYAEVIIMAQTSGGTLEEPDTETGLLSEGETERSRLILIDLGVPEESIIIIPSMTRSTRDEAEAVRTHLDEKQEINSIILVTSSAHTRRAYIIFTRKLETLDRDVRIISRASRHDSFQVEYWWRDLSQTRTVLLEYLKIIYFYYLYFLTKG